MMADIFRAKEPFACTDADGVTHVVTPGTLVSADDPIYKGREASFEEVHVSVSRAAAATETATAAPGELRSLRPPTPGAAELAAAQEAAARRAAVEEAAAAEKAAAEAAAAEREAAKEKAAAAQRDAETAEAERAEAARAAAEKTAAAKQPGRGAKPGPGTNSPINPNAKG